MNMPRVLLQIAFAVMLVGGTAVQGAPPAASAASAGKDVGLVAHWSMDEASGKIVKDRIGGDNNGTLHGKPSATLVKGLIGSHSLEFTAADQAISGSDVGFPSGLSAGSVSLWFNRPHGITDKVLFCYGSSQPGRGRGLWLVDGDTLAFYNFTSQPPDLFADIAGGITPGRWHQVVATYDGETARLYYDGNQIGKLTGKFDTRLDGTFRIGANLPRDHRDFEGMIDNVAVYDRELTAKEIRASYDRQAKTLQQFDIDWNVRARAKRSQALIKLEQFGVQEIIFAARPVKSEHWYANFGYWATDPQRKLYSDGGQLCRLDLRSGKRNVLLDDPKGGIRDPQVHYDGQTILFSYRKGDQPYYHLYEIQADGTGLRQLTGGPYDDFEPTYLPNGEIVFCSSRCRRWVPCWSTQVAVLYRCDADGQNIRKVSSNIEQENTPCVLPDGRLLYTRWEYLDRSQVDYHHLWTVNPDGTGQMVYFGNQYPGTVMIDAQPIPGTRKVVASFSPGHGRTEHMGAITVVDPRAGPDAGPFTRRISSGADFRDPYPLAEDCFLVARNDSILLMDGNGVTTALYTLPTAGAGQWCHEPRPLLPRKPERIIRSRVDPSQETGRLILANVNLGRSMQGVKPGEIKKLLVLESLPEPINFNGAYPYNISWMEPISFGGTFALARVLGTVPVEPDGSAHFELPALRSLFFVALDEANLSVKRMQSFVTVQPGETTSCTGCHEQRTNSSPPVGGLLATQRPPSRIEPFAGIADVADFPRDIQPILDKHCTACHNPDRRDGDVDLTGDRTPCYSQSYLTMIKKRLIADGRNGGGNRLPRTIGSSASRIMKLIDGQHHDVHVSVRERQQIVLWLETGATYAGTYAAYFSGMVSVKFPVAEMTRRCGQCHGIKPGRQRKLAWEGYDTRPWTSLPFEFGDEGPASTLCNLSHPEKSLLLLAPLERQAGGYGICKPRSAIADTNSPPVLADTNDPIYRQLLAAIGDAARRLDESKRFDMPGYRPNVHYIREMQRYGILAKDLNPHAPIDPYATDQAYWSSLWHRPAHVRKVNR